MNAYVKLYPSALYSSRLRMESAVCYYYQYYRSMISHDYTQAFESHAWDWNVIDYEKDSAERNVIDNVGGF